LACFSAMGLFFHLLRYSHRLFQGLLPENNPKTKNLFDGTRGIV